MICEKTVKQFCNEDISLIENYQEAINDNTQTWHCHHRLEIELDKSKKELINMNLYYNRQASELIFLTKKDHMSLHQKIHNNLKYRKVITWSGKHRTEDEKYRISMSSRKPKQRFKYLTPSGNIIEMAVNVATRYHPDWIKIGEV